MSYQTDDGQHEGWEAAEFPDGRFSVGTGNGGVLVRYLDRARNADAEPGVLDGQTSIGWRGVCECGWRGPLWERVTSPLDHDLAARKVCFPVQSPYADVPVDIEGLIWEEWHGHLPPPALADVRAAAEDVRKAEARLDEAVARARAEGSSWADVGDAAGITRQSAHERWAKRWATVAAAGSAVRSALAEAEMEEAIREPEDFVQDRRADLDPNRAEAGYDDHHDWERE